MIFRKWSHFFLFSKHFNIPRNPYGCYPLMDRASCSVHDNKFNDWLLNFFYSLLLFSFGTLALVAWAQKNLSTQLNFYLHVSQFDVCKFLNFFPPHFLYQHVHVFIYRTNLPKEIMQIQDFPFQETYGPSFVHHSVIRQYLLDYAKHFHLFQHIKVCEWRKNKLRIASIQNFHNNTFKF